MKDWSHYSKSMCSTLVWEIYPQNFKLDIDPKMVFFLEDSIHFPYWYLMEFYYNYLHYFDFLNYNSIPCCFCMYYSMTFSSIIILLVLWTESNVRLNLDYLINYPNFQIFQIHKTRFEDCFYLMFPYQEAWVFYYWQDRMIKSINFVRDSNCLKFYW